MSFSLYILISMSLFVYNVVAEPRAKEAALICSNRTATASQRQDFVANFLAAMKEPTPGISSQRYAAVKIDSGNETVYAFGECMKDLSQNDCNICFAKLKTRILSCLLFQLATRGGRAFYDGCYIRYDDYSFFNETLSARDLSKCGSKKYSGNQTVFSSNAFALVRNLSVEAHKNDGFFVGSVTEKNVAVYGLAEFWEPVRGSACRNCLVNADSYSILQMVWNLYEKGRLCEAVDPALKDKFPVEEASRILHIGLLCIQAAAELQPPMSTVVKKLTSHQETPNPAQPPFLSCSSAEISPNVQPGTTDSPDSNTQSSKHTMTGSSIGPR